MSNEHTPGPWYVDDYSREDTISIHRHWGDLVAPGNAAGVGFGDNRGVFIASICHQNDNPCVPKSRAMANAKLIAAAPELLSALELALSRIESLYKIRTQHAVDRFAYEADVGLIRAAIAKAKP